MRAEEVVKKVTYNVAGSLLDFLIWQMALVGSSVGKTGSKGVNEAFREADEILENINHRTLASAWKNLFNKELVTFKKRGNLYSASITDYGKKRLKEVFPQYQKERPWDNKIFLITYDIPEKARAKRNALRYYLFKINSRLLQESTFINPYNPRELVSQFVEKHKIPGTIIISDIGKDGGVGETTIQDLLIKVYSLDKLDERYKEFLNNTKNSKFTLIKLLFEYTAILKDDPQLPFRLLPIGWLGEKAYLKYEDLKKKYIYTHAAAQV